MAAGGSTHHTLRKAIGALKDSTKVGLAKVNSENRGIDVAIVKATNHDEMLAKEKHIRTIFNALSASSPRADVTYCIYRLTKRLAKTHNWTVALKTLVLIHRALKEVDHTFRDSLIRYGRGSRLMLNLSHFRDDSSTSAWDYSAWLCAYALYLEECLECFSVLKYDIQKNPSRMRELKSTYLLEQLPAMQQLLFRLLDCKPEGMALGNRMIHYALSIVAGESVKLYVVITDGILNLVDKYFEMERHDAIRALDIYKKATIQGEKLSDFFEICNYLGLARKKKFVKIEKLPASFLTAMEEYVAEAPYVLALEWIQVDNDAARKESASPGDVMLLDYEQVVVAEKSNQCETSSDSEPSKSNQKDVSAPILEDLLCLDEFTQEESSTDLDDKNSLALALVPSADNTLYSETSIDSTSTSRTAADWELVLITTTGSNGAAVPESKQGSMLDKSTLDSLYDNAMAENSRYRYEYEMGPNPNPFEGFPKNQGLYYNNNGQTAASNPFGNPFIDENLGSSFLHQPLSHNSNPNFI